MRTHAWLSADELATCARAARTAIGEALKNAYEDVVLHPLPDRLADLLPRLHNVRSCGHHLCDERSMGARL